MYRKREDIDQYFQKDEGYCPFKDIKLVAKKESPKAVSKTVKVNPRVYDLYSPSSTSIVRKNEDLPWDLLIECSPQSSLDLHGKRPEKDDIAQLVKDFLSESIEKGKKKVEIVVGKGKHSTGEPVIPGIVKAVLSASMVVKRFDMAPSNKGGDGVFWVILGERQKGESVVFSTKQDNKQDDIRGLKEAILQAQKKAQSMTKDIQIDYDSYLPQEKDKR